MFFKQICISKHKPMVKKSCGTGPKGDILIFPYHPRNILSITVTSIMAVFAIT